VEGHAGALAEVDSWWRLRGLLASDNPSVGELERDLDYLVEIAQGWGDSPSVWAFGELRRAVLRAVRVGPGQAFADRAIQRMDLLPAALHAGVARADSATLAYVNDGRIEHLTEAATAWHEILMSQERLQADPTVQLSAFNDAGVLMRELARLAPDPILLERLSRCWTAAMQLFRDERCHPVAWGVNLAPRLDMAVRASGEAQLDRYLRDRDPTELHHAIRRFEGGVIITHPEAPTFAARLADLGMALGFMEAEDDQIRGLDLLYFAAVLESREGIRMARLASFATRCWERSVSFAGLQTMVAALDAYRLVRNSATTVASLSAEVRDGLEKLDQRDQQMLRVFADPTVSTLSPDALLPVVSQLLHGDLIWIIHVLTQMADGDQPETAIYCLSHLASTLLTTYGERGGLSLLDRAVEALEPVLQHASTRPELKRAGVHNLALALNERYQRRGDARDLDWAIQSTEQAAAEAPSDPELLESLGGSLVLRFRRSGSPEDLARGIRSIEQALAAPGLSGEARYFAEGSLAMALLDRWSLSSDWGDLRKALEAAETMMATAPSPSRLANSMLLKSLCLKARYDVKGNLRDLKEAARLCREVLANAGEVSGTRPGALHQLGSCLRALYASDPQPADLDEAIETFRQAVEETATGAPHWPGYVSDLGTALEDRFGATGDLVDLDAAITAHEQALEASAHVKADRPMILHHLAGALRQRFRLTRYPGDLQAAAASAKDAVHECQAADPNRPLYLTSLGNTLLSGIERLSDPKSCLRGSTGLPTSKRHLTPSVRQSAQFLAARGRLLLPTTVSASD
jgi:tetratricopeptide (TPR) repeat protein